LFLLINLILLFDGTRPQKYIIKINQQANTRTTRIELNLKNKNQILFN